MGRLWLALGRSATGKKCFMSSLHLNNNNKKKKKKKKKKEEEEEEEVVEGEACCGFALNDVVYIFNRVVA
jgi:hypothetical protein